MAKCYLMIEDSISGLTFAADFGVPSLPENVSDLTEAQYATHQFLTVLRGMASPAKRAETEAEARSQVLLPTRH
jgi:hypothetical protein